MDTNQVIGALAALAQETRLKAFRLLMEYGPEGVPAGTLSDELGIPHNTLSFHLSHLSAAGLVTSQRDGRSIIYAANCDTAEKLVGYLTDNCCARGMAASCAPKPVKITKPQKKERAS